MARQREGSYDNQYGGNYNMRSYAEQGMKMDKNIVAIQAKTFRKSYLTRLVKENEIKASMKAGVLALEIPRVKPIQPEVKKIKIK